MRNSSHLYSPIKKSSFFSHRSSVFLGQGTRLSLCMQELYFTLPVSRPSRVSVKFNEDESQVFECRKDDSKDDSWLCELSEASKTRLKDDKLKERQAEQKKNIKEEFTRQGYHDMTDAMTDATQQTGYVGKQDERVFNVNSHNIFMELPYLPSTKWEVVRNEERGANIQTRYVDPPGGVGAQTEYQFFVWENAQSGKTVEIKGDVKYIFKRI